LKLSETTVAPAPQQEATRGDSYRDAMQLVGAAAGARLVGTTIALGAGFLTTVFAVRLFGVATYGLVAFGLSAVDLVAVLASLGLQAATVRSVSVLRAEGDGGGMARLVRSVFTVVAALGVLGAGLVFGLDLALKGAPLSDRMLLAVGLAGLLVARNAANATYALAQGLRRVVIMEIPNLVLLVAQLLVVGSLWLWGNRSIAILGIGLVICAGVGLIASGRALHAMLPSEQRRLRLAPKDGVRFLGEAVPYAVAGVAVETIADFDVLTLGLTGPSHEVGIYEPTLRVVDRLMIAPPILFNAGFVPGASVLYGHGDLESFGALYVTVSKLAYLVTFPLVVALAAFPDTLLHLIFGAAFPVRHDVVDILLVGYVTNLIFGLNAGALMATGRRRLLLLAYLISFVTMVTSALALVPRFGAVGAAEATALSYLVMNGAVGWALHRATGVHPFRRDMAVTVASSLLVLIAVAAVDAARWSPTGRVSSVAVLTCAWVAFLFGARVVRMEELARIVPRRRRQELRR
jgi:O-antigen/teichoic acid export membrane protein